MTQEWNPPVHMKTTMESGYSGGASSVEYFDDYGRVTPERMVLQQILATLKRIEALLQKSEPK